MTDPEEKEVIVEVEADFECTSTGIVASAYHNGEGDSGLPEIALDLGVLMCNTVEGTFNRVNIYFDHMIDAPDYTVEGTGDKIEVVAQYFYEGNPEDMGWVQFLPMFVEQCQKGAAFDTEWECGALVYVEGIQVNLSEVLLEE